MTKPLEKDPELGRVLYPHERMEWGEYIQKYSRGKGDPGPTREEFEEIQRKVYELALEEMGCDFEGDDLFEVSLVNIHTHYRPQWVPVPCSGLGASVEALEEELQMAHFNLQVAMSEFDRAYRTLRWKKECTP